MTGSTIQSAQVIPARCLSPNREGLCDSVWLTFLGKKVSMFGISYRISLFTFFFVYNILYHFLEYMNTNPIHGYSPLSFSVEIYLSREFNTQLPICHALSARHLISLFTSSLQTLTALFCYKLNIGTSNIKCWLSRSS